MIRDELVLLLAKDESYLVKITDQVFNTSSGEIKLGELKRKKYGSKIKTHLGKEFILVKPTITDFLRRRARRFPQVILPKDAALILAYTGVSPDSVVVDAGTGSGFLSIFLAYYLVNGKVITYEKNKKLFSLIQRNIKESGLKNIKLKQKDVLKGIDEKNVDLVTLDMKDAEKVVKHAYKALKAGGWLVVYSPYIEQVLAVVKEGKRMGFSDIKTVENVVREWEVGYHTLPTRSGIMHTGFITFARKVV